MAQVLFGLEARVSDEADALAVAVCCLACWRGGVRVDEAVGAARRRRGLGKPRPAWRSSVRRYGAGAAL